MRKITIFAASVGLTLASATLAQAQDFFSIFNNMLGGRASSEPQMRRSFAPSFSLGDRDERRRSVTSYASSGASYCVRTCDGRYFPLAATGGQTKAQACNSFCPASETKVVYGSSIDNAATDTGKSYSELPNAFRYRNEIVNGCTCNGKDPTGLAQVNVDDDKTLRRGDLVAGPNGLLMTGRDNARGKSASFSPVSKDMHARFSALPIVAQQ